ncbi:bifunctional 2-polyprenyl-6-hydroxyphenol methylase/3-demethylubiquinol 3-O-methyltransferase UbiG [Castellaniella sp.]|uniref:bifunctional 2-polyprenyl-6-hydroxyphenol methylase/3-demethylubiquinol 3-O-methyltransferase UbiG n=1 Tax=Castellaniella sp. TaxID=1955812 RepID=UPI003C770054
MNQPSNVDRQEIDKFDRVAQLWWDPDGKMGMLHVINPLRSTFVSDQAAMQQARAVDVGCGGGILTEALAKAGATVVGIDQSQLTLDIARQHAGQNGLAIDYRLQTVEQLAEQEAGTYDVVTCMEMLEHVPDPAAVVDACARLLKPGGHAFFSTINRTFKAFLFAIVGGEYVLRILPRGTHDYKKLIRPDELRHWTADSGLEFIRIASLMYNPLTRNFRVAPGREDVNYMASFVKKG